MPKEPYLSPPDADGMQRAERAIRRAGLGALAAFALCAAAAQAVLPALVAMPAGLAERLAFAALAAALVVVWVVVAIGIVSTLRRFSPPDIGGAAAGPPSPRLAVPLAFLQNTLEQAVAAGFLYLALAAVLPGDWLATLVPAVAFFAIGRVLFLRGYRRGVEGRALGMTLTMVPTVLGYLSLLVLIPWRLIAG